MKNDLTIAFLYNVRHTYPDPKDPRTHIQADSDDKETIDCMIKHFTNCHLKVIPIEANEHAYGILLTHKSEIDLAFNYAMGVYGNDRYAQIPAILEMLKIPYTCSTPLT